MSNQSFDFEIERQFENWVEKVSTEAAEKFEPAEMEPAKQFIEERLDTLLETWAENLDKVEDQSYLRWRWQLLRASQIEQALKFFSH